jgi:gas vesicle protein
LKIGVKMGRQRKSYLKGILYGSLIGAGIALFYSPRKGEESQKLLREVAEDTRLRVEDLTNGLKTQSGEWARLAEESYSKGRVFIEEVLDRMNEK